MKNRHKIKGKAQWKKAANKKKHYVNFIQGNKWRKSPWSYM